MHSWDPLSPWFPALDKFSLTMGGAPTPATIFPLLGEDHVNNHISLGVLPPNMDTRTLCQVEVTPCKSEGIEPFTLVNSLPGQVEVSSSRPINSLLGQVGVTPHKSEGIEPFTLSTLHQVKSRFCPRTRSTLRRVKSGSPLAIQEVSSPPPWSTLCQVKSGPHPRTCSTLRRVIVG